ncbi:MAG: site-specific DNA-methyltransferase [bacterium]
MIRKISKFDCKNNAKEIKTEHIFYIGNVSSVLKKLQGNLIQLIITSPPYWNARDYKHPSQLGYKDTYPVYLKKMKDIFRECVRILLPDGKIAINIGNIYNFDATDKRHYTINIIHDIWELLLSIGDLRFMGTIYWKKTTSRNGAVLFGSYPYPSNFMISTALEAIHIFRKIGKRDVPKEIKEISKITKEEFRIFREPIWFLNGTSTKDHPAVFSNEIPKRLIKMYSFYGDTVLDPFCGIGTTNLEALKLDRNSVGIDIKPIYIKLAIKKLKNLNNNANIAVVNKTQKEK